MNRDPLEVVKCVAHIEHVGFVCSPFFAAQCQISSLAVNSLREREGERERERGGERGGGGESWFLCCLLYC